MCTSKGWMPARSRDTDETLDECAAGADDETARFARTNRRERREQEANLFALELLVPAEELWQAGSAGGLEH
jgi:DNA helicase-2/ATP-dependent DNA helicase PcrA